MTVIADYERMTTVWIEKSFRNGLDREVLAKEDRLLLDKTAKQHAVRHNAIYTPHVSMLQHCFVRICVLYDDMFLFSLTVIRQCTVQQHTDPPVYNVETVSEVSQCAVRSFKTVEHPKLKSVLILTVCLTYWVVLSQHRLLRIAVKILYSSSFSFLYPFNVPLYIVAKDDPQPGYTSTGI